jgi:hypothetical protein
VAAFAATYTFDACDLSTGNITSNTTTGTDDFFTIQATSSKGVSVGSNSKSGGLTGTDYTNRFQTKGGSATNSRCISFTVDEPAVVIIEGVTGTNNSGRDIGLYKISDSKLSLVDSLVNAAPLDAYTVSSLKEGEYTGSATVVPGKAYYVTEGTYYVGNTSKAINLYGIVVKTGDDIADFATGSLLQSKFGQVYVDGTDAYVIAEINSAIVEKADKIAVNFGNVTEVGEKDDKDVEGTYKYNTPSQTVTTDTVYTSVDINGTTINPVKDGNYLYAVKLEDAGANAVDIYNLLSFYTTIAE